MSRMKKMYKFVSRKEDNWASIVITAGRYSGIIYQYGRIALNDEEDAEGNLTLSFDYNIIAVSYTHLTLPTMCVV